jgi:hypothetical protein
MIVKSWYWEDLAEGEVSLWQSGGVKPVAAVQVEPSLRPTKLPKRRRPLQEGDETAVDLAPSTTMPRTFTAGGS